MTDDDVGAACRVLLTTGAEIAVQGTIDEVGRELDIGAPPRLRYAETGGPVLVHPQQWVRVVQLPGGDAAG